MPIHPKLQEFLREVKGSSHKSFSQMSIQEMRQATKNFKVFQGDSEDIHQVIKKSIKQKDHEYQMRLYYPSSKKGLPLILFFHSGGFVKGDVEFSEPFCRRIANGAQAIVASVNYRLAPEHRFPSALEDAYSALCWVYEHAVEIGADKHKIAVMGESSGGNLAAALAIMTHSKQGPPLCFQVLVYPQLDYTRHFPSHTLFAENCFLTEEALMFYASQYLPEGADKKDPYISPYFTKHYQHLPPAYIITAEYDPLRDEAEEFAKNLKEAGVRVVQHRFPGMIHGFISMPIVVEEARQGIQLICETLLSVFRKDDSRRIA